MGSRVKSLREQHERNKKRKRGEMDENDDHEEGDVDMSDSDDVREWVDPVRRLIFIKYIDGINRTFR